MSSENPFPLEHAQIEEDCSKFKRISPIVNLLFESEFRRILTVPALVTPLITGSGMFSGVAKPIIVYG